MKKLLFVLPMLAMFSAESRASRFPDWQDFVRATEEAPFISTSSIFQREEVKLQIADDVARYDLSGEITPSLESYLEKVIAQDMTIDQAINALENIIE
jgi:hypothetical protein